MPALCKVSARLTAEYATCVSGVVVGAVRLLVLVLGLKLMVVFLRYESSTLILYKELSSTIFQSL